MKLHEEFKEYENLWEATEAEDLANEACLWTTPEGNQIDLNDPTEVQKEIDHLVELYKIKLAKENKEFDGRYKPETLDKLVSLYREHFTEILGLVKEYMQSDREAVSREELSKLAKEDSLVIKVLTERTKLSKDEIKNISRQLDAYFVKATRSAKGDLAKLEKDLRKNYYFVD